jgi:hypothetical protein
VIMLLKGLWHGQSIRRGSREIEALPLSAADERPQRVSRLNASPLANLR